VSQDSGHFDGLGEAKTETIELTDNPIWKSLPKDIRPKVLTLVKQVVSVKSRIVSGPLPSSEELAKYEQIAPGAANRLLTLVEQQSAHRISIETYVIRNQQIQSYVGQILGFLVAIAFLIGAVYTVIHGNAISGTIIGSLDLIGLVTVFVLGRSSQRRNLDNKQP